MTQKVIEVVGTSKESFAKAAENAVAEAAKTVRGMRWARVAELEMELDGKKISKYRTTTKIYFNIEKERYLWSGGTGKRENRFLEVENWVHTKQNAPTQPSPGALSRTAFPEVCSITIYRQWVHLGKVTLGTTCRLRLRLAPFN
jgi:flavin-binding protein dodecin